MAPSGLFRLFLAKEEFKFSAAHFTLLAGEEAEPLHGHNYRVTVEVAGPRVDEEGLLIGFDEIKHAVRAACARLDDRVLIPARSPRLRVRKSAAAVEVAYGTRSYSFPAAEVVLLPLRNSSVELLARMLWEEIAPALAGSGARTLEVAVEETPGQRCAFAAALPARRRRVKKPAAT